MASLYRTLPKLLLSSASLSGVVLYRRHPIVDELLTYWYDSPTTGDCDPYFIQNHAYEQACFVSAVYPRYSAHVQILQDTFISGQVCQLTGKRVGAGEGHRIRQAPVSLSSPRCGWDGRTVTGHVYAPSWRTLLPIECTPPPPPGWLKVEHLTPLPLVLPRIRIQSARHCNAQLGMNRKVGCNAFAQNFVSLVLHKKDLHFLIFSSPIISVKILFSSDLKQAMLTFFFYLFFSNYFSLLILFDF